MSQSQESQTATTDHDVITIAPGIELVVDKKFHRDHEDLVRNIARECKVATFDRTYALARLEVCIEQLATIDEERGGEEEGLVMLSYAMGWISNSNAHTTDDYRRMLNAMMGALSDHDLVDALDEAEFQVKKATGGEA